MKLYCYFLFFLLIYLDPLLTHCSQRLVTLRSGSVFLTSNFNHIDISLRSLEESTPSDFSFKSLSEQYKDDNWGPIKAFFTKDAHIASSNKQNDEVSSSLTKKNNYKLWLIGASEEDFEFISKYLTNETGTVIGHVGEDAWLVLCSETSAKSVPALFEAQVAPYRSPLNSAPEWDPILEDVAERIVQQTHFLTGFPGFGSSTDSKSSSSRSSSRSLLSSPRWKSSRLLQFLLRGSESTDGSANGEGGDGGIQRDGASSSTDGFDSPKNKKNTNNNDLTKKKTQRKTPNPYRFHHHTQTVMQHVDRLLRAEQQQQRRQSVRPPVTLDPLPTTNSTTNSTPHTPTDNVPLFGSDVLNSLTRLVSGDDVDDVRSCLTADKAFHSPIHCLRSFRADRLYGLGAKYGRSSTKLSDVRTWHPEAAAAEIGSNERKKGHDEQKNRRPDRSGVSRHLFSSSSSFFSSSSSPSSSSSSTSSSSSSSSSINTSQRRYSMMVMLAVPPKCTSTPADEALDSGSRNPGTDASYTRCTSLSDNEGSDVVAAALADWPAALASYLGRSDVGLSHYSTNDHDDNDDDTPMMMTNSTTTKSSINHITATSSSSSSSSSSPPSPCTPIFQRARRNIHPDLPSSSPSSQDLLSSFEVNNGRLVVSICLEDLPLALDWLALQPVVHWIEPVLAARRRNVFASIISQTGSISETGYAEPYEAARHPFWLAGIDGTGEVVGIADDELDYTHCQIFDPDHIIKSTSFTNRSYINYNHRKLISYYVFAKLYDGNYHGCHTTGTLAGAALCTSLTNATCSLNFRNGVGFANMTTLRGYTIQENVGMAPAAKVAFYDIGSAGSTLSVPDDLAVDYLKYQHKLGVRVHSDSWGSSSNAYDSYCMDYDTYLWLFRDAVSFIAAGNDGDILGESGGTVFSPANAKNVVAVGAVYDEPASRDTAMVAPILTVGSNTFYLNVSMAQDSPSWGIAATGTRFAAVLANPQDACSPLTAPSTTAPSYSGAVVIVVRGNCPFSNKTLFAQSVGAAAVLVLNLDKDTFTPLLGNSSVTIPMGVVFYPQANPVLTNLTASNSKSGSLIQVYQELSYSDVAAFSGYGPTSDNRIKPDLVSPGVAIFSDGNGYQQSYETYGTCNNVTLTLSGTSMATPSVAGHAALARQYFRNGYYPTGDNISSSSAPFVPSGMLLKALLTASAADLSQESGYAANLAAKLATAPNAQQGYGRMDLRRSLPIWTAEVTTLNSSLTGVLESGWRMQVVDWVNISTLGEQHVFTGLTTNGGGDVIVGLSWYDYPSLSVSSIYLLADLDLTVTLSSTNPPSPSPPPSPSTSPSPSSPLSPPPPPPLSPIPSTPPPLSPPPEFVSDKRSAGNAPMRQVFRIGGLINTLPDMPYLPLSPPSPPSPSSPQQHRRSTLETAEVGGVRENKGDGNELEGGKSSEGNSLWEGIRGIPGRMKSFFAELTSDRKEEASDPDRPSFDLHHHHNSSTIADGGDKLEQQEDEVSKAAEKWDLSVEKGKKTRTRKGNEERGKRETEDDQPSKYQQQPSWTKEEGEANLMHASGADIIGALDGVISLSHGSDDEAGEEERGEEERGEEERGDPVGTRRRRNQRRLQAATSTTSTSYLGNGGKTKDNRNTVERVSISAPAAGQTISISVTAAALKYQTYKYPSAKYGVSYGLVVLGHFDGTIQSVHNPAYSTVPAS